MSIPGSMTYVTCPYCGQEHPYVGLLPPARHETYCGSYCYDEDNGDPYGRGVNLCALCRGMCTKRPHGGPSSLWDMICEGCEREYGSRPLTRGQADAWSDAEADVIDDIFGALG